MRTLLIFSVLTTALGLSACAGLHRDAGSGYNDENEANVNDYYHDKTSKEESDAREELGYGSRPLSEAEAAALDERLPTARAGNLEGNDPDADRSALSILFHTHVLPYGFKALLPCFFDRAAQLKEQSGPRHFQQIEAGLSRGEFQKRGRMPSGLENLQLMINQHRRRHIPRQEQAVSLSLQLHRDLQCFRRLR